MHTTALLILIIFCVQTLSPVLAQDSSTGSGTLLTPDTVPDDTGTGSGAALPSVPEGSGATLPPPVPEADSGAILPDEQLIPLEPESPQEAVPSGLSVVINEVHWAGTDLSTADEWLELAAFPTLTGSTVTQELSLDGWTINQVKNGVEEEMIRFGAEHIIQSGSFLVVANYGAEASRLRQDAAHISTAISLPNTKLLLRVRNASGSLIDEVDDGVGIPFAGANPSGGIKAGMERIAMRTSGTLKENWRTADTARGLDSDAPVRGTPGYPNGTIEPPDTQPPEDVTASRAFLLSGALIALWTPGSSPDAASQHVSLEREDGTAVAEVSLSASATGVVLEGEWLGSLSLRHHTADDSGHVSTGVLIYVQPLAEPIISEVLPDPAGPDDGEWIELVNHAEQVLDLTGWILRRGNASYSFPPGTGSLVQSGGTLVLRPAQTQLTLPNAGGEVELLLLGRSIDRMAYPALPEGVSYARRPDSPAGPVCMPTPGLSGERSPEVLIDGIVHEGEEPLTLNLAAVSSGGTLAGAQCRWDFGDGYVSERCNPPPHRMREGGNLRIHLEVVDYCGNTMIHTQSVHILQKGNSKEVEVKNAEQCPMQSSTGIVLSEVFPAPGAGEDEWVEIRHIGGSPLQLCGWSIDDREGGSKPFPLDGHQLGSGEYLLLTKKETGIALNNDQDIVRIIGPVQTGGTSTGVLQSLAYQRSRKGESFAIRPDGKWLWSPFPTPGSENRFTEVDMRPLAPVIELASAMPNPAGNDRYDEWIELRNATMRPQWLNGWQLRTESGAVFDLHGRVLARKEILRINLWKTGFTLRNKRETLLLIDPAGQIRSVLSWAGAKNDEVIRQPEPEDVRSLKDATVIDSRHIRGTLTEAAPAAQSDAETVALSGVQTPPDDGIKFIAQNLVSALIKDKKVDLKNDSKYGGYYAYVEGADIAPILLRAGLSYVPGGVSFLKRLSYEAYERDARRELRGIWANDELVRIVDQQKHNEALDAHAREHGLELHITPDSGVVASGSLLNITSDLPAEITVAVGTGATVAFSGSLPITEGAYRVSAVYRMRTGSGDVVRSTVSLREYALLREHYAPCIAVEEVYPSPLSGEQEWVELRNVCAEDVRMLGWQIDDEPDAGSKPYSIGSGMFIPAGGVRTLSGAALRVTLNNTGDELVVSDPAGIVSSSVRYPSIKRGYSYALAGDTWCLTAGPTPGARNECIVPPVKTSKKIVQSVRQAIGVGTSYQAAVAGEESENENNKIERSFTLFKGLNANSLEENVHMLILVYLVLLGTIACALLLRVRRERRRS